MLPLPLRHTARAWLPIRPTNGRYRPPIALLACLMIATIAGNLRAQEGSGAGTKPLLHPLFSEDAVLQRDRPVPIWGWTKPMAPVTVQFDTDKQVAQAGADGRWTVTIPPHPAGEPHTLIVTGAGEAASRKNLLFGDVWLCGGQSNMAYDLHGANHPEAEIAAANHPNIRLLSVSNAIASEPISTFDNAGWQICSPQTVGTFSAVGYFFGRKLQEELKVPIGLINSTWSGTPAQSWVSGPALAQMPEYKDAVEALKRSGPRTEAEQMLAWWRNDPGTRDHQEAPAFDDANWPTMDLPGMWETKGYPDFDGVMWFRRAVDIPASWAGREVQLNLGGIDDKDTTYWNGAVVGATDGFSRTRSYPVPAAQVKPGRNVIAVRVLDTGGPGGFSGPALSMKSGPDSVSLDGPWKVHQGPSLQTLPPLAGPLNDPNAPVVLFNGKIAPLLPGEIKGIVWYQGESNADRVEQAEQYRRLLPVLINDWRAHFGAQTPFYIMQLANFKAPDDTPRDDAWPRLRDAQLQTARTLPNTGLVVLIDLGEEKNVHFPNKQEAGLRLAQNVLSNTYGAHVEASGPTLRETRTFLGAIQLTFDHAQGLHLKGDETRVFAVAGADKVYHWAKPQVAGNMVSVSSAEVPDPLYARFGWSNNPRAWLYNAAGLPASPFQTAPANK